MPLAFLLGWAASITNRKARNPARFARVQVHALTGIGTDRGWNAQDTAQEAL